MASLFGKKQTGTYGKLRFEKPDALLAEFIKENSEYCYTHLLEASIYSFPDATTGKEVAGITLILTTGKQTDIEKHIGYRIDTITFRPQNQNTIFESLQKETFPIPVVIIYQISAKNKRTIKEFYLASQLEAELKRMENIEQIQNDSKADTDADGSADKQGGD